MNPSMIIFSVLTFGAITAAHFVLWYRFMAFQQKLKALQQYAAYQK